MKHSIRFHAEEKRSEYFIICPLCPTKVRFQEALVNHCRDVHEDEECVVQTEMFKSVKDATDDAAERSSSPCSVYDDPFIPSEGDLEEQSNSAADIADKPSPSSNVYDDTFIPSAEDFVRLSGSHDDTADRLLSSCSAYEEPLLRSAAYSEEPSGSNVRTTDKLFPSDIPDDPSISALALMEEASAARNESGRSYHEHQLETNSVLLMEPSSPILPEECVVPAGSQLGCPSCAKLKKRVAELQVTVDMLKKKLPRVEEPELFDNMIIKKEIT
ncbi:hypothetical protein TELCIR_16554 [Teladorsagia circumcincta]|uniref:C2H2-type domain-containing protein n=1 Tax=Teladorsagia circumcincta TaxID=45464 RepID=A0A2G9TVG6_TELCI|nr:hypothetical protein TELCIR_16554 [Teladorsagia circumcincta]